MLYNADGTQLLAAVHGSALEYTLAKKTSYQLVIGGYLGDTAGKYTVNMVDVGFPATQGSATFAPATSVLPITPVKFSSVLISSPASLLA
jgi:hypothetical protein